MLVPTLSTSTVGAPVDVTVVTDIPQDGDDSMFSQVFGFNPVGLQTLVDDDVIDGTVAGDFDFLISLGFFNTQCVTPFAPDTLPLLLFEATTERPDTIGETVVFDDGFVPDLITGLEPAITSYPKRVFQQTPGGEQARYWAHTTVLAGKVDADIHVLVYPVGGLGLPAALGNPVLTFFNTDDIGVALPTAATDDCPTFFSRLTFAGIAGDNGATGIDESDAGVQAGETPTGSDTMVLQANPTTPGTVFFPQLAQSRRDADFDGIVNGNDTCPYDPNVGDPYNTIIPEGFFDPISDGAEFLQGLTVTGAGDPKEGDPEKALAWVDGIDAACDADPLGSCGPGTADDGPLSIAEIGGSDCDGDGFMNRDDDCPQVFDDTQANSELLAPTPFAADGGPKDDETGDACDPNDDVSDGHFHQTLTLNPVCIEVPAGPGLAFGNEFAPAPFDGAPFDAFPFDGLPLFGDFDGDGWCNVEELALGSGMFDGFDHDPGEGVLIIDVAGSPEGLSIPTTCDDGDDNDGLGGADIADAKCQQGDNHDLEIVKVTGSKSISKNGRGQVNVKVRNNTDGTEVAVIGVVITGKDDLPGCYPITAQLPGQPEVTAAGVVGTAVIPANDTVSVGIKVTVPGDCPGTADTTEDYDMRIDVCHPGDPAPRGLFGGGACPGDSDGNQDRDDPGNDAQFPVSLDQKQ